MTELQIFNEQEILGKPFKMYGTPQEPLFLAKDVKDWIEHNNISLMLQNVDEDEKLTYVIHNSGQNREMWLLTENGLYEVLMQSRKPIAKEFKKQVKHILKQIRQTGGYIPIQEQDSEFDILIKAVGIYEKTLKEKDNIISSLQPKIKMFDTFLNGEGCISLNKTAKSLGLGRNTMMAFLRGHEVLFKDGSDNIPYQKYCKLGLFNIIQTIGRDGRIHTATRVTPKGVTYICNLYNKHQQKLQKLKVGA